MKLLKISIHGFKSFADKVTIDIKDGITGIVGPNGSGKSNIVDAIKWVLGEQSLKDIRGGNSSADVIFSGSKSRNALTRAWVSLTFDNSDHYLNTDLVEVEIKRVVYSSGENEYYINNEIVRLKDITNLFIDSGSSVDSLSIISQGKIGEIINAKPEEKRTILEEAARVLKYKKRKEETLRKLDKTNDNLSKVTLIIDELSTSIEPLKEQSEVAKKYLEYKEELEKNEIGLLARDIKETNDSYLVNKNELEEVNELILKENNSNLIDSSKIDNLKLKLTKLEDSINEKSSKLYKKANELSTLESEKQIMIERQKYEVDDVKLEANILNLKERELKLKSDISSLEEKIIIDEKNLSLKEAEYTTTYNEYKKESITKNSLLSNLSSLNKEEASLKNEIDILRDNIDNDSKLPYAVKSVLNNIRLKGIHDTLGKILETDEKYATAIDYALGSSNNVVIVDNEVCAKDAISYLKQNGIGRVTFFPLNKIKPRGIDANTIMKLRDEPSYLGTAASLVKFNNIYHDIVHNVLGNVLVVDNLVNANHISKLVLNSYKIVTLDGEVINPGGSITGGKSRVSSGSLNQKFELENKLKSLNNLQKDIKVKEEQINESDQNLKILENKIFSINNDVKFNKELILKENNDLINLKNNHDKLKNEIAGTKGLLNNSIDKQIEDILSKYYKVSNEKESLEISLNELKINKHDLQSEINELEIEARNANSKYNQLLGKQKDLEVNIGKQEMKLDNYLLRLNEEYGITYEKALEYEIDGEESKVRSRVNSLKKDIRALGDVNVGAIKEYERINERYTFLTTQKEDLTSSISDLLSIINELDNTMVDKLKSTYNTLNEEFGKVFKKLFRGGEASLVLNDPSDILNTGLDIKAIPPGKDIKSTRLLSGGESTLTAIALVFAVLNIRTVPFCVFDEIEAALDEVNVDMFGNYLKELNTNTQFIIITHKKRTMEYINNLYGITMQESGVSKLVSVKLD